MRVSILRIGIAEREWIWLGEILNILFQCVVSKMNAEQLLTWLVMATTIRYSIGNPKLHIPPENTIALRSPWPFLGEYFHSWNKSHSIFGNVAKMVHLSK